MSNDFPQSIPDTTRSYQEITTRIFVIYNLDQLGLSEEVEEINYYGQTYRLSLRQKLLRGAQQRKERQDSLEIHPDVSASQQRGRCRP